MCRTGRDLPENPDEGYAGTPVSLKMGRAEPAFPQDSEKGYSGARIVDQLHYQSDSLQKLLATISNLEERLSPILVSVPTGGDDPNVKRPGGDSDLSELIDRNNAFISRAQREVAILIEKLQL